LKDPITFPLYHLPSSRSLSPHKKRSNEMAIILSTHSLPSLVMALCVGPLIPEFLLSKFACLLCSTPYVQSLEPAAIGLRFQRRFRLEVVSFSVRPPPYFTVIKIFFARLSSFHPPSSCLQDVPAVCMTPDPLTLRGPPHDSFLMIVVGPSLGMVPCRQSFPAEASVFTIWDAGERNQRTSDFSS